MVFKKKIQKEKRSQQDKRQKKFTWRIAIANLVVKFASLCFECVEIIYLYAK